MGKNRKCAVLLIGMLASLFGLVSSTWAEFHITPSVTLREEYNDNIFLTQTDKEGDFISSINPAISLGYSSNLLTVSLDYGLTFVFYARHSDRNLTSPQNTQRARLATTVSLYKDIVNVKVFDEYSRVAADVRRATAIGNYLVNMTDSNAFGVNPYVEYPLSGTLKAKLSYEYKNQWYNDSSLAKYQSHDFQVGLIKELSPQITLSVLYDYIITDYKIVPDYNRQNARASIQYQVTPQLTLSGSAGETWLHFKDLGNSSNPTWNVSAKYDVTRTLSLAASYLEDYYNSASGVPFDASYLLHYYSAGAALPAVPYPGDYYSAAFGASKKKTANAAVSYSGNIPITVTFTYTKDKYLEVVREDEWKGVTISTSNPFTQKITGRLTAFYYHYTFLPDDEKTERYGANVALAYAFRIATLDLGYIYNRNDSKIDINDYSNNIVYLQARFAL